MSNITKIYEIAILTSSNELFIIAFLTWISIF